MISLEQLKNTFRKNGFKDLSGEELKMIFISPVKDLPDVLITISDDHKTFKESHIFNGSMTVGQIAKKYNI